MFCESLRDTVGFSHQLLLASSLQLTWKLVLQCKNTRKLTAVKWISEINALWFWYSCTLCQPTRSSPSSSNCESNWYVGWFVISFVVFNLGSGSCFDCSGPWDLLVTVRWTDIQVSFRAWSISVAIFLPWKQGLPSYGVGGREDTKWGQTWTQPGHAL